MCVVVCLCVCVCVCVCVCKTGAGVVSQSEPTLPAESRALVLPRTAEKTLKNVNLMLSRRFLKSHFLLLVDCGGQPLSSKELFPFLRSNYILLCSLYELSN